MGFKKLSQAIAIRCLKKWGIEPQLSQTTEECLELAIAANHAKRAWCNDLNILEKGNIRDNVIEEMVDVENMIEQMKVLFKVTPEEWNAMLYIKRARIQRKLKGKKHDQS